MHWFTHRLCRSHLIAVAAFAIVAPAAMADFLDDFDSAGDVSGPYSYFINGTGESGGGVDTFTGSDDSSFALDAANSEIDMFIPNGTGFNFLRLTRSADASNQYDLTQGASVTVNVTGLNGQNFGPPTSMREPLLFGFAIPGGSPIVVFIHHEQFSNDQSRVRVQGGGGDLPGGAAQIVDVGPNNKDLTFNIDADSYSVVMGGTTVIPDTLHGLTLDPLIGAIPFFEARHGFDSIDTALSVQSFAGTGTPIPEPGAAALGVTGVALLFCRRRN